VLLAFALGLDRSGLHVRPAAEVPPEAEARFRGFLERRARREPLQHLTGVQEFWSLRLRVTPAVLIPRPETEGLVEAYLALPLRPDPLVVDIGTGSGCLAIAVARETAAAVVHATDLSGDALAVARWNAVDHGVAGRIVFHEGDLLAPFAAAPLPRPADVILSNPPYIAEEELAGLEPEVRCHEPPIALTPGPDGLAILRRILADAGRFLAPGGHLIVEMGAGQSASLRALFGAGGAPGLELVEIHPDLAGIPRVLVARRSA
jgi:release factor glutamine methyltransferase